MTRTKNNLDPETQAALIRPGRRTTRTVVTEVEAIAAPVEDTDDTDQDDDQDNSHSEELPVFDDLLDGVGIDEGEQIELYRYPQGAHSPRSGAMVFVTKMDLTPDLLSEIQTRYGGGTYVLVKRGIIPATGRNGITRRKTVTIDGPPRDSTPPPVTTPAPIVAAPVTVQAQQIDPIDAAVAMVDKLRKLAPLLNPPRQEPIQPARPEKTFAEQVKEVLEMQKLMGSIAQPPAAVPASSWLQDAGYFFNQLGVKDILTKVIQGAVTSRMQAATAIQMQRPAAAAPAAAPGSPAEAVPAEQIQVNDAANAFYTILRRICDDLTRQAPEELTADYLKHAVMETPDIAPIIDACLSKSAFEILQELSQVMPEYAYIVKLPHASAWIDNLKIELSEQEGDEQNETEATQ